jgi:hypothetical protein
MTHFAKDYPRCVDLIHVLAPIDQDLVDYLHKNAGIERARVDRLEDPYLLEPVIGILWADGTTTIIDGNHRIVKNFERGHMHVRAVLFKYPFWETFLIPEHISDKLVEGGCLTNESNIIEKEKIHGGR